MAGVAYKLPSTTAFQTFKLFNFPRNPSHSFSFHSKRRRFITLSLDNSSSSFDSKKSAKIDVDCSKPSLSTKKLGNDAALASSANRTKQALRFKSILKLIFWKRSLWRRILFASNKVRSIILLNVSTIVYASSIPILKEYGAIIDPAAFTAVRFMVCAIPFIPFILRARGNPHTRNAGVELGFWISLGYLMQALGLLTSDAGRASFLSMFTVIVVPLLDGILGAVVPAHTWFGALMSIIGVGMLESSGSPPCVGDFLNFLSAVFFGVHLLRTEQISRTTNMKNFLPLLGYEVCVIAFFSMLWYFLGGWFGGTLHFRPSWTWKLCLDSIIRFPWIPALYTGIFSTGLSLWVEMAAMRDISATETAIIYGLEPVWGAGFAWFLLGERWGITGWIGAALVLGGSLTMQIFGSLYPIKSDEDEETGKTVIV
ncbi:hypothetical protein SLA2020_112580 [Shorea laevis]